VTLPCQLSYQFTAAGGTLPYSWTVTGAVDEGLSFSSDGLLSGERPSNGCGGSQPFSLVVTDARGLQASATVTINWSDAVAPAVPSNPGTDGGDYTGPVGEAGTPCDAAGAGRDCDLSMPVSGGLSGTLDGYAGCSQSKTSVTEGWLGATLGTRVTAAFTDALPSTVGTYTLASLQITTGPDGSVQSWTAPSGACSITVTAVQTECQIAFQQWTLIASGTGTCSQPAAPDGSNGAAAVTIGSFQFSHWVR